MKRLTFIIVSAAAALASSAHAQTYDFDLTAKVTAIEASYMPDNVVFKLDNGIGQCPAGSLMSWQIKGGDAAAKAQNAQAVFALLLTAKSTNQTVFMYGRNSDCSVAYIYIQ